MVVIICTMVWHINVLRIRCGCYKPASEGGSYDSEEPQVSRTATALQDKKIQLVLVLAGLRGAVSLALIESVPLYNAVTGEGSEYKPEMKAMTSASILFTMFVFGGSAYYVLRHLDIQSDVAHSNNSTSGSHSASLRGVPENSFVGPEKIDRRPRPESPVHLPGMS